MSYILITTETIIARNAGALYGKACGFESMTNYSNQMNTNPNEFLSILYSNYIGASSTAVVAESLIQNLGITNLAAAQIGVDYVKAQLDETSIGMRGALINDILSQFSRLTTDPTFGVFATVWNTQIAKAENYAKTPSHGDISFANITSTDPESPLGVNNPFDGSRDAVDPLTANYPFVRITGMSDPLLTLF